MKKYELTDETINYEGHVLHRIQALKDIDDIYVKAGDLGGYVETENNLSHRSNCWIFDNAKVYDCGMVLANARVRDNATVYDHAIIGDCALIADNAKIHGFSNVRYNANIYDNIEITGIVSVYGICNFWGNAIIQDKADYIVFKNWWSSGRYFVWTRSNNMWSVGCFYGTGKELIEKAYKDSELSGREYKRVVKYVESILKEEKK